MRAKESQTHHLEAHELLKVVTRLEEVRRRFIRNAGSGARFDRAEQRLDSVILELKSWLKPGGAPADLDDVDARLATVEEMIEGLGLPGYARVVASVRETLSRFSLGVGEGDGEEPPPPRRFEPPSSRTVARASRRVAAGPETSRRRPDRRRWFVGLAILASVLGGCVIAALALGLVPVDGLIRGLGGLMPNRGGAPEPAVGVERTTTEPLPEPTTEPTTASLPPEESFRVEARTWGQLVHEIESAEAAMDHDDLDSALQHLAAAAAIDRHDRGVVSLAESLINHLLRASDEAFDHTEWERAGNLVDDARHLANGLYLDTSAIDQMARKHAAMTRFDDVTPDDPVAVRQSVGRSVRVTLSSGGVLFGRLEAFASNRLELTVLSGLDGGGVRFSKEIPLDEVAELRVYEASQMAETILGDQ